MPFYGYGLSYCNVGSCPVVDCPADHDTFSQSSCNRQPAQSIGLSPNNPVDLSKHCTATNQGTWCIGKGESITVAQPRMQIRTSASQGVRPFSSDCTPSLEAITCKAENKSPAAQTKSVRSAATDIISGIGAHTDNADCEEMERIAYERHQAALLAKVRASGFPLPFRPGEAQVSKATF